jgi:glycosyltransferase involved in cell wall biosynthesis
VKDTPSKITIVVPFRNIHNHVLSVDAAFAVFLDSLVEVSKHVHEVILVSDHSADHSVDLINSFQSNNWKVLKLGDNQFGKKAALEKGIRAAVTEYIWTLDSDVEILNFSLSQFEKFQNELHEDLVILPVLMKAGSMQIEILQGNEWRYMQLLTWLSARMKMPMMCNGANLIFKRASFFEHIDSHRSISSGDDLFLMAKIIRSKGEVGVCWKGFADVVIFPVKTLLEALIQRIRWAGKTTKLPVTKSSVLHFCFALFSALHLLAFVGCFFSSFLEISLIFLSVKMCLEVVGIRFVFSSRMKLKEMAVLIPQLALYPFFSLSIFISSLFFVPKWKGRRVSLK